MMRRLSAWSGVSTTVLVLAAAAGVAGPALMPTAQGQVFTVRSGGPFGADGERVSRASWLRYQKLLGVDEAQKQAADELFTGYQAQNKQIERTQREAMRAAAEAAEDGDSAEVRQQFPKIMNDSREARRAATKSLLDELKSLLTADQAERWPRVERLRRREELLPGGMVSGSGVDLTSVVEAAGLGEADLKAVADTLSQYENDMDSRLKERASSLGEPPDFFGGGGPIDMAALAERADKDREDSMKTRELNQRYARLIAGQLTEGAKAKFEKEFQRQSFRRIYRETEAIKKLRAALKLEDLQPEQREELTRMLDAYERETEPLNARWAEAQEKAESEGAVSGGGISIRMSEEDPADLAAARKARRDYDKKVQEQLNGLLTADQKDKLPKTRRREMGPDGEEFIIEDDGQDEGEGMVMERAIMIQGR